MVASADTGPRGSNVVPGRLGEGGEFPLFAVAAAQPDLTIDAGFAPPA